MSIGASIEATFFVHAEAVRLSNGKYSPDVSVMKQQARRVTQVSLELEERIECDTEEEAILLGRNAASTALREGYPEAQVRIK